MVQVSPPRSTTPTQICIEGGGIFNCNTQKKQVFREREMVVANSWGVRNAAPSSSVCYLKPSSGFPFSAAAGYYYGKKESNLNLSFESSIPKSRNGVRNSKLCCRCTDSSADWDWNRWNRHFSEIEQAESFASVLKFQLEDAIEKEDFLEAAKLKTAIAEATSKDIVAEIMSQLKTAIDEERYHDASKLCKLTGSGLVGWWVGFPKDSNDPFGRIVRIAPSVGRFVARSYTPRQLVTASSGTPLFEIFVIKEADQSYNMQVVFLLREKGSSTESTSSPLKLREGPSISNSENLSTREVPINEKDGVKRSEEKNVLNSKDDSEEEINNVIEFLKDRIPGLTVELKKDSVEGEIIGDSDPLEKLTQEDEEKTRSAENSDDEAGDMDDIQGEGVKVGGGTGTLDEEKKRAVKLFIGGVLHHLEGSASKEDYVRSPAAIKDTERDSFVLHIPGRIKDVDESKVSNIEVAAVAAQGASVLMPPDVAKAFWGVGSIEKAASKVSKDVRQMAKLVISQMLNRLPETTSFSRIHPSTDDLDPFNGLYVGAFGPYGTEVVQLRRKFGHWHDGDQMNKFSDTEFYEYVEAVKLTGDLNVPAGQVLFRAKIGKGNRIVDRMKYPDQIGVVASYKGEGRIAEFGFQNPRWVDGELLQLNGKGMKEYLRGATLGFLYVVPEKRYLVLFNRLKLPEFSV